MKIFGSDKLILKGGKVFSKTYLFKEDGKKILSEVNDRFSPFCHATDPSSARRIDEHGLKIRGMKRPSTWEGELVSKSDRVYFASISEGVGGCIQALDQACVQASMPMIHSLKHGVFYVLEKIPEEYADFLTYDEDIFQRKPPHFRRTSRRAVLDSLETIGSFGIKHDIDRELLIKLTPREFFYYAQAHNDWLADFEDWNAFVESYITEREGKSYIEWFRINEPELWELEKGIPFPKDQKRISEFFSLMNINHPSELCYTLKNYIDQNEDLIGKDFDIYNRHLSNEALFNLSLFMAHELNDHSSLKESLSSCRDELIKKDFLSLFRQEKSSSRVLKSKTPLFMDLKKHGVNLDEREVNDLIADLKRKGFKLILNDSFEGEGISYDETYRITLKDIDGVGLFFGEDLDIIQEEIELGMIEDPQMPFMIIKNHEERIVAHLSAYILSENLRADENYINFSIGVLEAFQGKGLSKWLLYELVKHAIANNIKILSGDVINPKYGMFLKKIGFTTEDDESFFLDLDVNEELLEYL